MGAYLVFTEVGPLLVLTSCRCVTDERVLTGLQRRGIGKFVAYEVPLEHVHRVYGVPFEVISAELEEGRDLRVLDFNGQHIFACLSLAELGRPVMHEH